MAQPKKQDDDNSYEVPSPSPSPLKKKPHLGDLKDDSNYRDSDDDNDSSDDGNGESSDLTNMPSSRCSDITNREGNTTYYNYIRATLLWSLVAMGL